MSETHCRRFEVNLDLEGAVEDAALMARLTVEFIGRALGFDDSAEVPSLNQEDGALLQFAVLQTVVMADRARDIFRARNDADMPRQESANVG